MGTTINWRLAQEMGYIKNTLDNAEQLAGHFKREAEILKIPFEIRRINNQKLFIDVGGCETLGFDFKFMTEWEKEAGDGFGYENETLKDYKVQDHTGEHYEKYPEQKLVWASGFCKTQFIGNIAEHKWVAELIRAVAGRCKIAEVNDEGDYYHTGNLNDAEVAIESLGKMINGLGKQLQGLGYENTQIIKGGETKIKNMKK